MVAEELSEEAPDADVSATDARTTTAPRRIRLGTVGYGALIVLPFLLALVAGGLKFIGWMQGEHERAQVEAVYAASDTAVKMLSYRPDSVQNDLEAAKSGMSGSFRDSYSSLVDDVVAPAAIQRLITATATVAAAAPVSVKGDHAVVLLFVNQKMTVGTDAPRETDSTVRVTLDKADSRWLVSKFDPQ